MKAVKDFHLFNTLTRRKELFVPITPGEVTLYTCGPTVYHFAHIGNLRTYVFEDILVRALKFAGYHVQHVMNITDVGHLVSDGDEGEDKMEKGARREGKTAWDVAEYYTKVFFADMEKLGIEKPNIIPKATEHIPEMIAMVEALEKKGIAYRVEDGIYFDTSKFPHYGDFARLDIENLEAGKRVAMGAKRNSTDFALWKFSPAGEKRQMEWDSPWGKGFPGWHIECSAMSMKYLGETFDIHCGGIDHIPVHHTNEIAQSEAVTGKPFVHYWMHGEFLNEDAGKMSKSKGEILTVSALEAQGYHPMDYRFLLLQAHYRASINFHFEALKSAQNGLNGILERLRGWKSDDEKTAPENDTMAKYRDSFSRFILDDLNTSEAMAQLFAVLKDASLTPGQRKKLIFEFDSVFGLQLEKRAAEVLAVSDSALELVAARDAARAAKNWAESDRLRDELQKLGFKVEDSPKGTKILKGQ